MNKIKNNIMLFFIIPSFLSVNASIALARRIKIDPSLYNYRQDAARIESVLGRSNNAVLITSGLDADTLKRVLEAQTGEFYRYVDLQELIDEFGLEGTVNIVEQMIDFSKEPLLINKVDRFLKSDIWREKLLKLISNSIDFVGITDFDGYRKLEEDKDIAEKLNFLIESKNVSPEDSGKKVAVIGASGLLGGKIYEVFSAQFDNVIGTCFSNTDSGFVVLDAVSKDSIRKFLRQYDPDVIIYAAGAASVDESANAGEYARIINAEAMRWFAENFNGKFVYISTDYVFDGESPPYVTDSARNPLNYYGETKVEGENIVEDAFTDTIIVRPSILYGYNSNSGEIIVGTNSLNGLLAGEELQVDNKQVRYPVLADDVASSILRLVSHDASGIFHLGGREAVTKYQLIVELAETLGLGSVEQIEAVISAGNVTRPYNPKLILSDFLSSIDEGLLQLKAQIDLP